MTENLIEYENGIEFMYLYRDGANYKRCGSVGFTNKHNLTINDIDTRLRSTLSDGEYFIARQINIPEVYFDGVDDDDHCWHEYDGVMVEPIDAMEMDALGRDISELLEEIENIKHWNEYTRIVVETPINEVSGNDDENNDEDVFKSLYLKVGKERIDLNGEQYNISKIESQNTQNKYHLERHGKKFVLKEFHDKDGSISYKMYEVYDGD
jgi:hypothetical protein